MLHHYIRAEGTAADHWGVSRNDGTRCVLVQLADGNAQVRLALSPEQAESMAKALQHHAATVRALAPRAEPPLPSGSIP